MAHWTVSGTTGSGKTNFLLWALLKEVRARKRWIKAVFPHRKAGLDFIAELYAIFGDYITNKLIVEDLEDMTRVIPRSYIQKSTHSDYWARKKENELFVEILQDMLFRRRADIKSLSDHPVLEKHTRIPIRVFQELDMWIPEYLIPYVLRPKSPEFDYILSHLPHPELRAEMENYDRMPIREQIKELEPAARPLESMFGNSAIMARTTRPQTFDERAFLNSGGIKVILGGDVADDAIRVETGTEFQETVRYVKEGLDKPGIFVADEVNNYVLAGRHEGKAMATVRGLGKGMDIWFATQRFNFPTEEVKGDVLTNSDQFMFPNNDPDMVDHAARLMRGRLDENKVHHVRSKQVHAGFEEIDRVSTTVSEGERGKTESKQVSKQLVPKYTQEAEEVFQTGNEQMFWEAVRFSNLPVGSCFVKERGRAPYQLSVPLLPDSWALPGLAQMKTAVCLQKIKALPIYVQPAAPLVIEVTTSSAEPAKRSPSQSLPKVPGHQGTSTKKHTKRGGDSKQSKG